jgi:hypothetical protein
MKNYWVLVFLITFTISGCSSIGPDSVERDRFNYNTAISNSWKEQTLLNIIKIRYADMPLFVEVASIVSGYTFERAVNINGTLSSDSAIQGDFFSMGSSGKFTDRPTITYRPITGQQFNKSFMTPIPPKTILFLIQSGWPADLILQLTVDSINGMRSRVSGGVSQRSGDADFYRVVSLFRQVQKSGSVGMRIVKNKDMQETTIMFFHRKDISSEIKEVMNELGNLLGLKEGIQEIPISYGYIPPTDSEIAMLTRSMMQIMIELATQVDVPVIHIDEGRTNPASRQTSKDGTFTGRTITINHSVDKPENAFTAVLYRDYWFWIDDRDFLSKRTFAFLMILFSLTETGGSEGLPLVTIPAS